MNFYSNAVSEINNILLKWNVWLCRPPLGDYRYWDTVVLMSSNVTITLLVALALGLLSSGFSSSELSSFEGAGTGRSLRAC